MNPTHEATPARKAFEVWLSAQNPKWSHWWNGYSTAYKELAWEAFLAGWYAKDPQ